MRFLLVSMRLIFNLIQQSRLVIVFKPLSLLLKILQEDMVFMQPLCQSLLKVLMVVVCMLIVHY